MGKVTETPLGVLEKPPLTPAPKMAPRPRRRTPYLTTEELELVELMRRNPEKFWEMLGAMRKGDR